jgi:hypothetical protein
MTLQDQLDALYKIQEQIRAVQDSGLWEPLHEPKRQVIKLIQELEDTKLSRIQRDEAKWAKKLEDAEKKLTEKASK